MSTLYFQYDIKLIPRDDEIHFQIKTDFTFCLDKPLTNYHFLISPVSFYILLLLQFFVLPCFFLDRFVKGEVERKCAVNKLSSAKESLLVKEQKISQMEADLKIEKEWRQRLQTTSEADKEALSKQKVEMTHLQTIANVNRISLGYKRPCGVTFLI